MTDYRTQIHKASFARTGTHTGGHARKACGPHRCRYTSVRLQTVGGTVVAIHISYFKIKTLYILPQTVSHNKKLLFS